MSDPWVVQPTLEGGHVVLRPLTREDGPAMAEAASDGKLWELFYTGISSADDGWNITASLVHSRGYVMPLSIRSLPMNGRA